MSLLVDVQEVPWRILELVRARILANRESKARRQQVSDVRKHTRPRPQQRRMGATMSTYREPEPVPLVLDDLDKIAYAQVEERPFDDAFNFRAPTGNSGLDLIISNRSQSASATLTIPGIDIVSPGPFYGGLTGGFDNPGGDSTAPAQEARIVTSSAATDIIPLPCGGETMILLVRHCFMYAAFAYWISPSGTGSGQTSDTYSFYAAYLVTPSAVRRIAMPQTALNKIQRIAPDPSNWTTQSVVGSGFIYSPVPAIVDAPTPASGTNNIRSEMVAARAFSGWGLYRHNPTDTSAGIFSFLESYVPGEAEPSERISYNYWLQRYMQGAPVPNRFLGTCVLPGVCSETATADETVLLTRGDRTSVRPQTTLTTIPTETFRPGTKRYTVNRNTAGTLYTTWDWGRPAYCRQQLLALGFTEADLSP